MRIITGDLIALSSIKYRVIFVFYATARTCFERARDAFSPSDELMRY